MLGRIDDSWMRQMQGRVGRTRTEVQTGFNSAEYSLGLAPNRGVYRFGRNRLLNV